MISNSMETIGTEALRVISRSGESRPFDITRIENAVAKAYAAVAQLDDSSEWPDTAPSRIAALVAETLCRENPGQKKLEIEKIQDAVEQSLMAHGLYKQAKAYMLYRSKHKELRTLDAATLDIGRTMDGYLGKSDWRVNENANINYSLGGLILHNSGAITANYWLNSIYSPQIAEAHRTAAFHIHDLSMFSGYCAGWSLRQLIVEGLGGVRDKISSTPARHLGTLVQQMVNFLGIMQNEWAGAQAFSSFDTYLAPFVREDGLSFKEVKQALQSFIYGVNTPSRWGSQAPFTNITLDWMVPADLSEKKAVVGGRELEYCYGDLQAEMDMINRAFLELMITGDASGRGFQYPIPTYNITKDFAWETDNALLLFEMTAKYGTPYFQNFINSELDPGDVRSMCCRLQLDKRELRKRGGGLFGSDEFTGSIGVVTINLPQIGYQSTDRIDFFTRLDHLMDLASESLEIKRRVVERLMDQGLFPYTKRYLSHLNNHFSTIGIVGMNEALENFMQKNLLDRDARSFALEILDHMRSRMAEYQEKTGSLYNLEASPAEGTSYRLALHDKKNFPGIFTAGSHAEPFYTNSSQLPVESTSDIFDALDLQDELQKKYTGGTVFHGFLGESIRDWKTCAELVRTIAHNYHLPYFTISPTFSICQTHGYLNGEVGICPHCGAETEIYSRIVGYYRALKNWNKGKKSEYDIRNTYDLDSSEAPGKDPRRTTEAEYFFTPGCPRCPSVKGILEESGLQFTAVNAAGEEGARRAAQEGILSVPFVIFKDQEGGDIFRSGDVRKIGEFLENQ